LFTAACCVFNKIRFITGRKDPGLKSVIQWPVCLALIIEKIRKWNSYFPNNCGNDSTLWGNFSRREFMILPEKVAFLTKSDLDLME